MEKTYKEYLEEILCSKVSDNLTGAQKQELDAVTELLGFCDYERLCELAKADKGGRCVIAEKPPKKGKKYVLRSMCGYCKYNHTISPKCFKLKKCSEKVLQEIEDKSLKGEK